MLGLCYEVPDSTVLVLNNLSPDRRTVNAQAELSARCRPPPDLFTDRDYEPLKGKTQRIRMEGRGYRWIRLRGIY